MLDYEIEEFEAKIEINGVEIELDINASADMSKDGAITRMEWKAQDYDGSEFAEIIEKHMNAEYTIIHDMIAERLLEVFREAEAEWEVA